MPRSSPILIEITGSLGTGKGWLLESLSRTFGCPGISFPTLDPDSFTSTALMRGHQKPDALLVNPHWWAHMAAANIYEQWPVIASPDFQSPLVLVKNYVTGYRNWFSAIGVEQASSFVGGLPRPNLVFVCRGEKLPLKYAIPEPTNDWVESRYERKLSQLRSPHIHTIDYGFFKEKTMSPESLLSLVSLTIAEKIRNKYNFAFQLQPKQYSRQKLQVLEDESEETTG